jgi:hypothetical protein
LIYSPVLQQLFNFRVVFRLDLLVVEEILLFAFMLDKLKPMAVEGVFILVAGDILDYDVLRDVWAQIGVWFTDPVSARNLFSTLQTKFLPDVSWLRRRSILVILVVIQLRRDVMLGGLVLANKRFDDLTDGIAGGVLNCSSSHN